MNYWTEFKCLSCARTCCEAPGKEAAAWRALARGAAISGGGCATSSRTPARCKRCGGRLYAADTYEQYGDVPAWREATASGEAHKEIPRSA